MIMPVPARLELVHRQRIETLCAALESGRYQQAQGALKNELGNCCLGVACDVRDPDRWYQRDGRSIWAYLDDGADVVLCDDEDEDDEVIGGAIAYLTSDVARWYGFPDENPKVTVACLCTRDHDDELGQIAPDKDCEDCGSTGQMTMILTELNDEWRLNFRQIAHAIRQTFLTNED